MSRPSAHLSWTELACRNRLGRVWNGVAPGAVVESYPQAWRASRAKELAATFETIRLVLGERPITVTSAYRTPDYNRAVGGARQSQHVFGRALDIKHATVKAPQLFEEIREMYRMDMLPHLGGIGKYLGFVHIDVRTTADGRLAVWYGTGEGA